MVSGKSNSRVAFHCGQWVDAANLTVNISDPMVTHAVTAVERVRSYDHHFFQLDRHLARFAHTAEQLRIDGLPDLDQLTGLIAELTQRNEVWLQSASAYGVLLLASPGRLNSATLIIDLYPIDSDAMQSRVDQGQPLVLTDVQQPAPECWSRQIKTRCRIHYYLADHAARTVVPGALGVLVDADGSITETSIANILVVQEDTIYSPEQDQILPGISLEIVRQIAIDEGIKWTQQRIQPQNMRDADEILLTGTSCGIWFANSLDGKDTPMKRPIYQRLRRCFDAAISD